MNYKIKGVQYCAHPGCLSQVYGGEIMSLVYCPEHIDTTTPLDAQYDRDLCRLVVKSQGNDPDKFFDAETE